MLQGAAAQGAVSLEHDAALAMGLEDRASNSSGLHSIWLTAGRAGGDVSSSISVDVEVAHADVAGQPRLAGLDERLPEADVAEPSPASGSATGRRGRCPAGRGSAAGWRARPARLGGHLVVTKTSSRATPLAASARADLALVAVDGGGVEVAVAGLERGGGRADASSPLICQVPKPRSGMRPSHWARVACRREAEEWSRLTMQPGRPAPANVAVPASHVPWLGSAVSPAPIVVVGGGLAAGTLVTQLRERGYDGDIVLLADEALRAVRATPALEGAAARQRGGRASAAVHDEQLVRRARRGPAYGRRGDGHRHGGAPATVPATRGSLDRLLVATGRGLGTCAMADESGVPVAYLRSLEDRWPSASAFAGDARIVIVGGGWIGLEVASAARQARGRGDRAEVVGPPAGARARTRRSAQVFADLHREHGVDLRTGVEVVVHRARRRPGPS